MRKIDRKQLLGLTLLSVICPSVSMAINWVFNFVYECKFQCKLGLTQSLYREDAEP